MKVLFTTNIPVPYRVDFFNELGKAVDLTVLFERSDAKTRNADWLKFDAKRFKPYFLNGIKFSDDLSIDLNVINFVRKNKFDIVIIGIDYSPTAMLIMMYLRLTKIPVIFTFDGGYKREEKYLKRSIKKYIYGLGKGFLSPSKECDNKLISYSVNESQIHRYPFTSLHENEVLNYLVTDDEKLSLRKKLGITEKFVILGVGRLVSCKRWNLLIECMEFLPNDCGLYIIGDNPKGSVYEKYLTGHEQDNRFHFINFKPKEELAEFYKAADLMVLPSKGEVWGLVTNEAMAKGLPVVISDTCGSCELIEDGINGFIFQTDNINSMAESILKVYHCTNRDIISNNNIKKMKDYTIEKMSKVCLENIRNIYNSIQSRY